MDNQENLGLNDSAFECLDEAMFLSSNVSDKERQQGRVKDWDNVYPTSREETERMEQLLQEAESLVEDPRDTDYAERYEALAEVVEWSKKRHRSWHWQLIAGALLGAGIFYYFANDQEESIARAKENAALVEKWDSTEVGLDIKTVSGEYHQSHYNDRLKSAKDFKMFEMSQQKFYAESSEKYAKENKAKADTASTEEKKESYLKQKENYEKTLAKRQAMYDSISAMNFAEVKAYARERMAQRVESEEDYGNGLRNFMIYLLILIPLYIISGYPRGYTITRHRRMSGCLTSFRKIGFGIATFFFGTGMMMNLLPDDVVKYHYSDGHTETRTEANVGNFIVLFMKFGLMIVGAFIFCFVSAFIMTIETVFGLIRNFDWKGRPQLSSGSKQEK